MKNAARQLKEAFEAPLSSEIQPLTLDEQDACSLMFNELLKLQRNELFRVAVIVHGVLTGITLALVYYLLIDLDDFMMPVLAAGTCVAIFVLWKWTVFVLVWHKMKPVHSLVEALMRDIQKTADTEDLRMHDALRRCLKVAPLLGIDQKLIP